jgi:hypothetical protein
VASRRETNKVQPTVPTTATVKVLQMVIEHRLVLSVQYNNKIIIKNNKSSNL